MNITHAEIHVFKLQAANQWPGDPVTIEDCKAALRGDTKALDKLISIKREVMSRTPTSEWFD